MPPAKKKKVSLLCFRDGHDQFKLLSPQRKAGADGTSKSSQESKKSKKSAAPIGNSTSVASASSSAPNGSMGDGGRAKITELSD